MTFKVLKDQMETRLGICQEWDTESVSFSTQLMTRNQDISFGTGSPIVIDVEPPTFTCRASFSSFMKELSVPCLPSSGFSFCSPGDPNALEPASPLPSMPSFAFFRSGSDGQGNSTVDCSAGIVRVDVVRGEASLEMLLAMPDSSTSFGRDLKEMEHKTAEVKRAGGTIGSRMLRIHSKRNRTIGPVEHEQLSFMVSE